MKLKKDKKVKKRLKTYKNRFVDELFFSVRKSTAYITISITICVCILSAFLIYTIKNKKVTYASSYLELENDVKGIYDEVELQDIDINQYIDENTKDKLKEEIITQDVDLEYITKYKDNSELPKGIIQVVQEGRDGVMQIITKKTYKGEELVSEEITGTKIIQSSVTKIIEIGTGSYTSSYKVKVGDTLYVTSTTLNVMEEANKDSNKITTLDKNVEVTVQEIKGQWYKISYYTYKGWVPSNCLTYLNPNNDYNNETAGTKYTKTQLLNMLSKSMKLNKPSGLSLDQFKKILSGDKSDTNNIFEENAEYFYYIERQYNINGIFVAAVGIHESAWGTSKIAQSKRNLFGYGASDSDPYNNAYSYTNYSESIDLIARVFVKYYLNPARTSIYDGQTASGKYYNGATLEGINTKYASDKTWANSVYKWMSYLYNKL